MECLVATWANQNPGWTEGQTLAEDLYRNRGMKLLHHE